MQPASGAPSEDKQSNQTSAMFLGRPRRHQSRTDTPRRRLAGRGRDRRGPLYLHGAADDVRGDAAADGAQGPRDGRVSAERLTPPGAGADVGLTAAQQADEIEALKLLIAHTPANNP